ncbi:YbjN domain-containing protein [Corynebacterium crudilactis]|uniref:YbjN domain-containing protein n=1 Tax=Corynebacterium crudilactis TaxID=1652495 RepID=A0A172QT31_9CORY|nr:YbjN domain-containing protein [Corynebacterium crudilactis]ANE03834.1 hypothetical protein ccrud_06140 [Corynebacterium crudilactis]
MLPATLSTVLTSAGLEPHVHNDSIVVDTPHFKLTFEWNEWLRATATWVGELSAADYVRSIVAINSALDACVAPKMVLDAPGGLTGVLKADKGAVEAHAIQAVPIGEGLSESQVAGFVAAAFDGAIELTREFHALYPERSPRQRGALLNIKLVDATSHTQVTPVRVANWFMDQGVEEVPYDAASGLISFELGDTPVDVMLNDPELLKIQAVVTSDRSVEATEVLHLCNRANLDSDHSTIFMRLDGDDVNFVATVAVPIRAGLNDLQLSQALQNGVVGVVGQVTAVINQLH